MKLFYRFSIFISFLFLLYTIYRSEIYWEGKNRDYYYIYWIVLIALIIFLSITLQLNRIIQEYVVITLISVVISLYLFEGYHCLKSSCFENYKKINSSYYDKRSPIEIYSDLKNNNKNLTISIAPFNHILTKNSDSILPLAGISNSNTIHCNENGYYSIYQSDRYGFNNPDEEWDSNNIEYLLVGDSFTHGSCVNRPDDIASVLRELSKKKVLNLGYEGNGPLLEYATFREYLKPGINNILWLYSGNDVGNLNNELKSAKLLKYLQDFNYSQDLKSKQSEIDKLLLQILAKEYSKASQQENIFRVNIRNNHENIISKHLKLFEIRSIFFNQIFFKKFQFHDEVYLHEKFRSIMEFANSLAISNNSKLYFVYLPSFNENYYVFNNDSNKTKIKKMITDLNIEFIDIGDEVFKKESKPLKLFPFERHSHYTVEGYKKTALKIYEKTK